MFELDHADRRATRSLRALANWATTPVTPPLPLHRHRHATATATAIATANVWPSISYVNTNT
jgi:hypothetical protein